MHGFAMQEKSAGGNQFGRWRFSPLSFGRLMALLGIAVVLVTPALGQNALSLDIYRAADADEPTAAPAAKPRVMTERLKRQMQRQRDRAAPAQTNFGKGYTLPKGDRTTRPSPPVEVPRPREPNATLVPPGEVPRPKSN